MTQTTRRYAESLLADAQRVEIRTLPDGRSALVTDADELLRHMSTAGSSNVYTSLNRPHPDCAAPIGNDDVQTIVRLPFDFDPIRPAGLAATDGEMRAALDVRDRFVRSMLAAGWPMPLLGSSGNGGHAVYRTFMPNSAETAEMLRALYRGLASEWNDEAVVFDRSVRNAGRIWRLYGTINRKGPATTDRPHRVATCTMPSDWQRVPTRLIERMASRYATRPSGIAYPLRPRAAFEGAGDYRTLDVVRWFAAHGHYVGHLRDHLHEVACPWEHEHSCSNPGDTIVYEADGGWPGFFCHHAHCEGRTIRDVIALWGDADAYCVQVWEAA